MTETTKTIFDQYEIRKTKKQKSAFIGYVETIAEDLGYSCHVEKSLLTRNIVIGDPETAKVVYTAHYDTCVGLPFPNFITPKCFPLYLLYQILIAVLILIPLFLAEFIIMFGLVFLSEATGSALLSGLVPLASLIITLGFLYLFFAGPANKHTANDNTSGVTTLLDIMADLPPEYRDSVAFIFFDLEEAGLFGSDKYYSKHKKAMKDTLLINFDCVSDGGHMIFALRKKAKPYANILQQAYAGNSCIQKEVLTKGVFYPSDQAKFPCGVGVAALNRTKRGGILYLGRIHTKKDTIYREENIEFLKNGSIKLLELMEKDD